MKSILLFVVILFLGQQASADILKDFDTLGGNDVLIKRAKDLQPDKDISIVQNRIVDRNWRHEFSTRYTNTLGGDPYIETQSVGFQYDMHINPYVSAGVGYFSAFNGLTKEGRFLISNDKLIPDVDAPQEGYEFNISAYPIYGKVNFFNLGILHFDFYALGSYGKIRLESGETDTYSLGGGLGLWISQYMTTRLEIRERFYTAQRFGGQVDMDVTVASLSLGFML